MTSSRRRLGAGAVALGVIAGGVSGGFGAVGGTTWGRSATASAATPTSSAAPHRFAITLDELTPKVVQAGDTVTLRGTMVNTSGQSLSSVSYALRISTQRITTRYQLAQDADPKTNFGVVLSSTRQRATDDGAVAPGQRVSWQLSLPIDRIAMPTSPDQFGAFPLAVEVSSRGESGTEQDRLSTTLLWMPKGAHLTPTKISWLWPVVDGIHRGLGDTFTDDTLATDLAPDGRLGKLVSTATAAKTPVTYVVDPALVDAATAMAASATTPSGGSGAPGTSAAGASPPPSKSPSQNPSQNPSQSPSQNASQSPSQSPSRSPATPKSTATKTSTPRAGATNKPATSASAEPTPYQVATDASGKKSRDGAGAQAAADWLAALHAAVTAPGSGLVALPYGDADLVALDRAGLDKEMAIARSTGLSMLRSELAAPTSPDLVWPVGGQIDEATLDDLASDLVTTVVLDGRALQPQDPNALAGPRADLQTPSGAVRALLTDPTINDLLANPGSVPGGARAAEQRFLAETMLVTEQRPGSGSSLVVAPPRHLSVNSYLAALLADSGSVPWLDAVKVGTIAAEPADDVARQQLSYPSSARNAELPTQVLNPIPPLRDGLAAFNSILGQTTADPFVAQANEALLRAESSSWRDQPRRATAIIDAVARELQARTSKVFISKPGLITLTSRKQKIPLTVVNNLPEPVTVQVSLRAVNAPRLTVTPIEPFTVDGGGSRHEVVMEVEATTGGRFEVQAQLTTADNRPIGQPVSFEMNSTAYGAVALAIAGGAAGLLFLLSGIRIYRRIRRRRNNPPDADADANVDVDAPTSPAQPVP